MLLLLFTGDGGAAPDVVAAVAFVGVGHFTADAVAVSPDTLGAVAFVGVGIMAIGATSSEVRRSTPRRELLWISGLDGTQTGVIG